MPKPTDVETAVKDLAEKAFKTAVDLDTPVDDVSDSLKLSELIIAIEQRFDVALEDSAVGRVRVLRDLVRLVEQKLGASGQP
jgi:acyl carrier protein